MSTWDDKPNDYDQAVAWALEERSKVARFGVALQKIASMTTMPSHAVNTVTLVAARAIAKEALSWEGTEMVPPTPLRVETEMPMDADHRDNTLAEARYMRAMCTAGQTCSCADNNWQWRDATCAAVELHARRIIERLDR